MKKYIILITFCNLNFCLAGVGSNNAMVINREYFGSEVHGVVAHGAIAAGLNLISDGPGGWGRLSNNESMGVGGSGRIMSDFPGSLDIGGLDGMRTLDLPTSFDGNIGGRF